MIRHTVAFTLRHPEGSARERAFLDAAGALAALPGVQDFQTLRETSPKNDFRHALSMEFEDAAAYAAYDAHPDHRAFVADRWVPEVDAFFELDTEPLD